MVAIKTLEKEWSEVKEKKIKPRLVAGGLSPCAHLYSFSLYEINATNKFVFILRLSKHPHRKTTLVAGRGFSGLVCRINNINKGTWHKTPWGERLHQLIESRLLKLY